jgi:subtilisin family serine protease
MSLGGGKSAALNTAVSNAVRSGITVCVAAGNEGQDACLSSPASAALAITVAASTRRDDHADFSNHGPCVDLYAPGMDILSALPNGHADSWSGTSMACPHVAGVAALVLEETPSASTLDVATRILKGALPDKVKSLPVNTQNLLLAKLNL